MELIDLRKVKIPYMFRKSKPRSIKFEKCKRFFEEHGFLDRDLVIDDKGVLRDGYIGYLVLQSVGCITVSRRHDGTIVPVEYGIPKTLVYGVHANNPKEFCWVINDRTQNISSLRVGNEMTVCTKSGVSVATITRTETACPSREYKPVLKIRIEG